jgi:hypothetical protein
MPVAALLPNSTARGWRYRTCIQGCPHSEGLKHTMLILLTLHFLASQGTQALPIRADRAIDQSTSALCSDIGHCRTIWNIVWSCLVTIFGCIWIAMHPNIPNAKESWLTTVSRRLQLMVMALIAPELVILWAMRQWFAARALAKKHKSMFVCNRS